MDLFWRWRGEVKASWRKCSRSRWRRTGSTQPDTMPSYLRVLCMVAEALVWPEQRAVSIDTLNTSYCRSQHAPAVSPRSTDLDRRSHFARAPAAPSDPCPWPEHLLKQYHNALAPGRRARSREGHTEERTEAHDTGEIDWKVEELEVPKGTSRLVPSRSTCRAPFRTRAHAP